MVIDYRERKPVQNNAAERRAVAKNKPRREPIGMIVFLIFVAVVVSFGAGLGTGWLLFKWRKPALQAAAPPPPAAKKEEPAADASKPVPANEPLTFYQTLPAGGKGALGSGLNLKKEDKKEAKAPVAAAPASAPAPAAEAKFAVQTASYRDKKEADAACEKLVARGLAAYVLESHTAEKGIWYRVRVGKRLTREAAQDLAQTAGQGAIVVTD